jgi:hypothetical protein
MWNNELPPEGLVTFLNPFATGYHAGVGRAADVQHAFDIPDSNVGDIRDVAMPKHVEEYVNGRTIVYSGGGDGTVKLAVAAITGHVQDDLEASASNYARHADLAEQVLYIAGPDGNANNFALSALGRFARHPTRLIGSDLAVIRPHRPGTYDVTDERGNSVRSGIFTSCFGVKAAAEIATELDERKPQLKHLPRLFRLASESILTAETLWDSRPFSADVTLTKTVGTDRVDIRRRLSAMTGFELIGSRVYAKAGRTKVNVDSTRLQPIVTWHHENRAARSAALATPSVFSLLKLPCQPCCPVNLYIR